MSAGPRQRSLGLLRDRAALLVVDVQEKLAAAMSPTAIGVLTRNVAILAEAARRFDMPVVLSEQYTRGLGPTIGGIASALAPLGDRLRRLEKLEFSVCESAAFASIYTELSRDQWIVTGMESHVCVYQTVRQLCERGASVHVVGDAVCSRSNDNWQVGLDLARQAGAIITSTEVVVFDLLVRAGGDDFKALSRLIR
jgi:nicotinamidase-related amidase